MKIRVVAAAILREGRVLAARRAPGRARAGRWELPGGKIEPGETDADALAREIAEELDLTVEVGEALAITEHSYPDLTVQIRAYACRILDGEPVMRDHDALRWLGPDALYEVPWVEADLDLLPAVEARLRR